MGSRQHSGLGRIVFESSAARVVGAPRRWRKQYGDNPPDPAKAAIQARLDALDLTTASHKDVDAIIGNTSWTREWCDVCDQGVTEWLRLGEPRDWESSTVLICLECLDEAHAFARRVAENTAD